MSKANAKYGLINSCGKIKSWSLCKSRWMLLKLLYKFLIAYKWKKSNKIFSKIGKIFCLKGKDNGL
mgnify:CR=1 FL=1